LQLVQKLNQAIEIANVIRVTPGMNIVRDDTEAQSARSVQEDEPNRPFV
jgi:hypothetical protein